MKNIILGGLWGALVGDALGVPVEFKSRKELRHNPVTTMLGQGTHNQPAGTWSDDSSLMLCTVDSLLNGFDTADMGQLFVKWMKDCYWTPHGTLFDIGIATTCALDRIAGGVSPEKAGGTGERDNGNGSLMRILPVAMFYKDAPIDELLDKVHRVSGITHGHDRSKMACGIYCLIARKLLEGLSLMDAYLTCIDEVKKYYSRSPWSMELIHFKRILSGTIHEEDEARIQSSGYVVHTLEASIWCVLNSRSYREAVLKAVNLGEDTDTTGIATGGIAGLYFGLESVPIEWRDMLARRGDVERLFVRVEEKLWS